MDENMELAKKYALFAIKGLTIVFLAFFWIWTLYPAPDIPIEYDSLVKSSAAEKDCPIYEIYGFNYLQSGTSFPGKKTWNSDNFSQFNKNVTKGIILVRSIDKSFSLWREIHYFPLDPKQDIQKYVEVYNPPPSRLAYDIKESDGHYYFGRNHTFVLFAAAFTMMAYVLLFCRRKNQYSSGD
jgi:hypothetical protein